MARVLLAGPESLTLVNTLAPITWSRTNRLELFAIRNSAWDSNSETLESPITILSVRVNPSNYPPNLHYVAKVLEFASFLGELGFRSEAVP